MQDQKVTIELSEEVRILLKGLHHEVRSSIDALRTIVETLEARIHAVEERPRLDAKLRQETSAVIRVELAED